ncbi:transposable element Tcb2 transposase [Trichonephila clavipes]|nr:transposable element Tcb2 transposase [Trichonephila clavipes]
MYNATVQQSFTTVSPNSTPIIVMLQAEAGFVSKHIVVPFLCPCPPFIAPLAGQRPVFSSQGPGSGCIRQTSRREDRHIVRNACVQLTASSAAIQAQVTPSLGPLCLLEPYEGTWLKKIWDRGAHYVCCHRRLRSEWCRVFSDEYRFNFSSDDSRVWRPRRERLNPAFALQQQSALTAGVMVWGAIA